MGNSLELENIIGVFEVSGIPFSRTNSRGGSNVSTLDDGRYLARDNNSNYYIIPNNLDVNNVNLVIAFPGDGEGGNR